MVEAIQARALEAAVSLAVRWVELPGERCRIYIFEAAWGGYCTWCDDADARTVECYPARLRRSRPACGARTRRGQKGGKHD